MPAEQGNDAERFAAAVDLGRPPGSAADAGLLRDLEIVAMLRSRGAEYSPHPDAKARAKQRLMAVLAEQDGRGGPPRDTPPSAPDQTAPLGRLFTPPFPATPADGADSAHPHEENATAVTTRMAAITPSVSTQSLDRQSLDRQSLDRQSPDAVEPTTTRSSARALRHAGRHTMPSRPSRSAGSHRPGFGGLRRRAVLVGSAAMVMLVALTSTGVFASKDALPGDNLYAVKRAAESAGLALTFDDKAKAQRHLELATTRLDEVEKLVAKQHPQATDDATLLRSAIQDFDSATGEGSRILLTDDAPDGAAGIDGLRTWASEQTTRLTELRAALPVPAADGAGESIEFLDRLLTRAKALGARSSCTEVTSGVVDDLGPLPAQGACSPRPAGTESDTGNRDPSESGDPTGTRSEKSPRTSGSSGDPEATPTEDGQAPGLLPDLDGPDLRDLPEGAGADDESSTTPASSSSRNLDIPLPLPLLPPITLPPLLPGQPGITIG